MRNRNRNASGVITLMHCLSTAYADYDLDLLPRAYFKKLVIEYHNYVVHLAKNRDIMPEALTSKGAALEKIRRHLVKLKLISNNQENNEFA